MPKDAVFTLKIESQLRDDFAAAAAAVDRPASQLVRELMRDFVQQQRAAEGHAAFVQAKVARARVSVAAGHGRSDEDVEAQFAARRGRKV